jgi:hypothetical protein
MNTTTADYIITNPQGHRGHETFQADQYAAHLLETSGEELIIATGPDDAWFCDICDTFIDTDTPIASIANYALCPNCASAHYNAEQLAQLPICPCPPCARTPRPEPEPEVTPYEVGTVVTYHGPLVVAFGPSYSFRIKQRFDLDADVEGWRYTVSVFNNGTPEGHLARVNHRSITPA